MKKQLLIISLFCVATSSHGMSNSIQTIQTIIQQNAGELITKAKETSSKIISTALVQTQEDSKKVITTAIEKAQEEARKAIDKVLVKAQVENTKLANLTTQTIMTKAQSLIDNAADSLSAIEKQSLMQQTQITATAAGKEVLQKTTESAVAKGMDTMRAILQSMLDK